MIAPIVQKPGRSWRDSPICRVWCLAPSIDIASDLVNQAIGCIGFEVERSLRGCCHFSRFRDGNDKLGCPTPFNCGLVKRLPVIIQGVMVARLAVRRVKDRLLVKCAWHASLFPLLLRCLASACYTTRRARYDVLVLPITFYFNGCVTNLKTERRYLRIAGQQ